MFYSLCVTCYQGLYVGLVWIYLETPASRDHNADTPVCWPELAVSRDGTHWQPVCRGTPLLPLGPQGSFDHRQIRTASSFFKHDGKIWLYYSGSPHPHVAEHEWDIGLATLRLDGFVSMDAGEVEGTLLTKPLKTDGGELTINAAVQDGGYVKAELLAADGTPLDGFHLDQYKSFTGDEISAALTWENSQIPANENLRIRFVAKKAKLYSFTIKPTRVAPNRRRNNTGTLNGAGRMSRCRSTPPRNISPTVQLLVDMGICVLLHSPSPTAERRKRIECVECGHEAPSASSLGVSPALEVSSP